MNEHEEKIEATAKWLKERPAVIQRMAEKVPYGALVKSKPPHKHVVPCEGGTAVVYGYSEPAADHDGLIIVIGEDRMGNGFKTYVEPHTVEVCGFTDKLTEKDAKTVYEKAGLKWPMNDQ